MTSQELANTGRRTSARPRLATLVAGLGLFVGTVLLLLGLAITLPGVGDDPITFLTDLVGALAGMSLLTTGALLVTRLPRHPVGWLLLGGGLLLATAFGGAANLPLGLSLRLASEFLSVVAWVPAVALIGVFVPLFFPTGHLPSRRWRFLVVVVIVAVTVSVLHSATSPFIGAAPGLDNPFVVSEPVATLFGIAGGLSSIVGIVSFPLVGASLFLRYRDAAGVERQQIKWFATVALLTGISFALALGTSVVGGVPATISNLAWLAAFVGFGLLPVAIAIAVLRYRLYDIDVILRRTAVYVPLTAILAGVYAASIALLQRLFIEVTGNPSDGAVIVSTLILATIFTPIKSAIQEQVDRTFRDSRAADRRLAEFVDGVRDSLYVPSVERVLMGFLPLAIKATNAGGGAAYAGPPGAERLVMATPRRGSGERLEVAVRAGAQGTAIGRIELDPASAAAPLRPAAVGLVAELAERLCGAMGPMPEVHPQSEPARGSERVASARFEPGD